MRFFWILVCFAGLLGCKSEAPAPAPEEEAAKAAPSEESTTPAGDDAPADPAAEAPPSAPVAAPAPAVRPRDPNAPSNVGAPPKKAKRTDSGLAWVRLGAGKGTQRPKKLDQVTIRYTGWQPDGYQFDSSERHGDDITVRVDQLIPGFAEGLRMMVPGEKRRLWIPAALGYGAPDAGIETAPAQPLGDLVFDVELVGVTPAKPTPAAPKDVAAIPDDAQRSESGLAWRVLEQGTGTDKPIQTSVVDMQYTMWTSDGEVVDSSALRTGVDTVGISRLVPGWFEGMKLMSEGERRLFWIPEPIAFAGQPHRPEGMLVVDVKLVQIRRDLHQVR